MGIALEVNTSDFRLNVKVGSIDHCVASLHICANVRWRDRVVEEEQGVDVMRGGVKATLLMRMRMRMRMGNR